MLRAIVKAVVMNTAVFFGTIILIGICLRVIRRLSRKH